MKKIKYFFYSITLFFISNLYAQTASDLVMEGRLQLMNKNIFKAYERFSEALEINSNDADANFFAAITRILAYSNSPEGKILCQKYGIVPEEVNIYNYKTISSIFPKDQNGHLIFPVDAKSIDITRVLKNDFLTVVDQSIANLNLIQNTSFKIKLSSKETTQESVTIDFADIALIKAALNAVKFSIFFQDRYETNFSIYDCYQRLLNNDLTAEIFLNEYKKALNLINEEDIPATRLALIDAIKYYNYFYVYSQLRLSTTECLFSISPEREVDEEKFRITLENIRDSLDSPTLLQKSFLEGKSLTVSMKDLLYGGYSLRTFLPEIWNNYVISTFPDVTFGNSIIGLSNEDLLVLTKQTSNIDDFDYAIENGEVTITEYFGYSKVLYIPDTINGYPVTKIDSGKNESIFWWFSDDVEVIIIPKNIRFIGNYAFSDCYKLKEILFSETITNIGSFIFQYCDSLETIYFKGDAPILDDKNVFMNTSATVYYDENTSGWNATFGGRETKVWNKKTMEITVSDIEFDIKNNKISAFTLSYPKENTLEYSNNMIDWFPVINATNGTYRVIVKDSSCYYRSISN